MRQFRAGRLSGSNFVRLPASDHQIERRIRPLIVAGKNSHSPKKMKYWAITVGLFFFLLPLQPAAQPGFEILRDVNKIEIPFEYRNNLIVVKVVFQNVFPLNFIFDTGAESSILARRELTDVLGIPYEREFRILGSDMKTEITAYLVRGIHLKINTMVLPNHSMLVLEDDYLHLDHTAGLDIQGILGADIFRGLIVKIDYKRRIITLFNSNSYKEPGDNYTALPIKVFRNKPYLDTFIKIQQDTTLSVRLLLDTGAMLSLLLNTETHPELRLPAQVISGQVGTGLGGIIEGYMGRVNKLDLGPLECHQIPTNFQELPQGIDTALLRGRNGVIGNQILSRFNVILDYPRETMYLRPNRNYRKNFRFDKSGLVVIAADIHLNRFIIHDVIKDSPAAEAGLQAGDEIKRINLQPEKLLSLSSVHRTFSGKEGKKVALTIKRGGKKIKVKFRLRSLI